MIHINIEKVKIHGVNTAKIKENVKKILHFLDFADNYEIDILLVNNNEIKKINKERRNKETATDVLSFPQNIDLISDYTNLGEVVISIEMSKKQAKHLNHTEEYEFYRLLVHGILHLLGYDHELNKEEEEKMFKKEDECLRLLFGSFHSV